MLLARRSCALIGGHRSCVGVTIVWVGGGGGGGRQTVPIVASARANACQCLQRLSHSEIELNPREGLSLQVGES